jgi:hypothetical protein
LSAIWAHNSTASTTATRTINGRQLYAISIINGCGKLLWGLETWHTNESDALDYGHRMAAYHHADEPAGSIRVSAKLA